jgi:ferredoxin
MPENTTEQAREQKMGEKDRRVIPANDALPTYVKDIVGEVMQWDQRDIVFARSDLFYFFGENSPQFEAYYRVHPEHLKYDAKVNKMPGLGRTGGVDTPMFSTQFAMLAHLGSEDKVDGEPAPQRAEIPPARAAYKVKTLSRFLGADLVKIGPLRQEWVYSHVARSQGDRAGFQPWGTPIDLRHHTNAIALGLRMDYDLIQHAPDFPVLLATAKGYSVGAWVSVQLAHYIRALGYAARAHHFRNYQVLCVPVAADCGLGELSRAGFLLTKEFGLAMRLAIVTTDMPLAHDEPPDLGVQSFCEVCKVCAESCPVGAIPTGDKVERNGLKKWQLDEEKCYRFWHSAGTDCGICMSSCPWTKPSTTFHKIMARLATIKGPHQSWMVRADKLFYDEFKGAPRPDFIDPLKKTDRSRTP